MAPNHLSTRYQILVFIANKPRARLALRAAAAARTEPGVPGTFMSIAFPHTGVSSFPRGHSNVLAGVQICGLRDAKLTLPSQWPKRLLVL